MDDEQVKKNNKILLAGNDHRDEAEEEEEREERVGEWETGLPTTSDLTPLSHHLISPELASAFSITAEPYQTMLDVNRATQTTLSNLRRSSSSFTSNNFKLLSSFMEDRCSDPDPIPTPVVLDEHQQQNQDQHQLVDDLNQRNKRKIDQTELLDDDDDDDSSARALKRPRLVWTPQLHKRFVDVVAHLGIDSAVPKTIMQLMNVEGLTRENVASHLQKYRLFLKRMSDGASKSSADQLFGSAPIPQTLPSLAHGVPLQPRSTSTHASASASYNSFEFHPQGRFKEHQGLCPPNNFTSILHHSHVSPTDK